MFWTECKTKTFCNIGRKGVWLWILPASLLASLSCSQCHGETLGHCACPRPIDSVRSVAKLQTWLLGIITQAQRQGASSLAGRSLQRSLPGTFQRPLPWGCFPVSAGFWALQSLVEQRPQLCFSKNFSVFLFYNPAPWITYPPVPLPDKLILPSPFFNRKTEA